MDKNYYQILGIKRNATESQIADSYRKLALVWNPKYSKQEHNTADHHFSEIAQAYDVLSDPIKKAFYDKYGWRKLTQQLYNDGGLKGGYKFGNNANQIFQKFFSSTTAFNQILDKKLDNKGSMFSHAFGGLYYKDDVKRQDLVVVVPCTLQQLYTGKAKLVHYNKKALNPDGKTLSLKHFTKLLQIKPGYNSKTVLRFKQQGNQSIERKTTDLVFKIIQMPEQLYSRQGNDLIYIARINLINALKCQTVQIITLDNRKLRVGLDQIPSPQNLKQVENQGMPIQDSKKKGNLFVKFDIHFPHSIPQQIRTQLRKLLDQN